FSASNLVVPIRRHFRLDSQLEVPGISRMRRRSAGQVLVVHQVVVEQVELAVGHVEIVGDWIPHGLKMVKILLLAITILIGENDFARYRVDLDLHAGMEIEVAFTDLRRGQRDVRRPVYIHVSRRAWRQRRNRDGADFQPASGITYAYSRRVSHQE